MPLRELSTSEQIRVLEDLDRQEKMYDKHLTMVKGDIYALKYKHDVNVEPDPLAALQETYRQMPTVEAIRSVAKELKRTTKRNTTPTLPKQQELAVTKEEPVSEEVKQSEEDIVLKKHNFPTAKEVEDSDADPARLIVMISHYNKNVLGSQLAQLTKKGYKDTPQYQSIQNDIQILKNYKNSLLETFDRQRVMVEKTTGSGFPSNRIKIGRYYANREDIKHGFLRIRKKNKSKVQGVSDMDISEGVRQLLLKRYDPKLNYSRQDFSQYRTICDLTGHRPKPHSKIWNIIYVTNVVDAQKRLVNAIGEIRAGNNNSEIYGEIVTLADFLLKNNRLTKAEYENLMAVIDE